MAEAKTTAKKSTTEPFVPTRTMETAAGSMTDGELVYLDPSNEHVKGLLEVGYLVPQAEYLEQADPVVLAEMERRGVSARESGSGPQE